MVWSFLDGCWFLTFTPGGNQQLSKLTHTLEDCQKLAEVLVRLGE
jgi:hypothetical protein